MATRTLTQPTHRLFQRLVIALLAGAVAVTGYAARRSPHPTITATHPSPSVTIPARANSGFTGTVNSGPDNPSRHTTTITDGIGFTPCTLAHHTHIC